MDDSVKITKNYKLMGTESDPVVIAQRLLNLYRQLHIFSPEKKEAYNKMLMEQTPEVKKMLGALPGGVVVQQYLAEIEKEAGVTVEQYDEGTSTSDKYQSANNGYNSYTGSSLGGGNPEAVREMVTAFKEAIVSSEKNRKEDTKELAQTIVALQSRLTQTILEKQTKTSSVTQSQMIKDLAETQTKEFSQIITQALREIRQMSNDSLVDAIQKVHKANIDFFRNSVTENYENKLNEINEEMADDDAVSLDEYIESSKQKQETSADEIPEEEYIKELEKHPEEPEEKEEVHEEEIDESLLEDFDGNPANLDEQDVSWKPSEEVMENNQQQPEGSEKEGDYEWEYVEDDGNITDEKGEEVEDQSSAGEEYEWEYVEEGENTTDETGEAVENQSSEGEDYEWEYVEDDDSSEEAEEDPYNPNANKNTTKVENVLLGSQENALLKKEEDTINSITLNDNFGLTSDEDAEAKSS